VCSSRQNNCISSIYLSKIPSWPYCVYYSYCIRRSSQLVRSLVTIILYSWVGTRLNIFVRSDGRIIIQTTINLFIVSIIYESTTHSERLHFLCNTYPITSDGLNKHLYSRIEWQMKLRCTRFSMTLDLF